MAILPLPTPPLTVAPTPTAANFDDLNDVMLPPDALSKRSSMAPHDMDYDQCHGIPPIVFNNPPNKRKGGRGNGAVLSPVRKKNPPPSSPARSQRGSVFIATAVSFATAKERPVVFDKQSPTSIVKRVFDVARTPAKGKQSSGRAVVKIGHIPRTEFTRFVREDHHYKKKTKYLEPQIKKDLLSKRFWLLHHFNTPQKTIR